MPTIPSSHVDSFSWLSGLRRAALALVPLLVPLGAALLAGARPAEATVIAKTFIFSASSFSPAAPTTPVNGSVTVTWNNAANILTDTTAGITLNNLNISLGSAIAFNYFVAAGALTDVLVIGGIANGVLGVSAGTNDLFLRITGVSTATPGFNFFQYTPAGTSQFFGASSGTVTSTNFTAAPEPMTLALLTPALLGLAAARRRR